MKTLGVGLIGSGFMGRTNAETVKRYLEGARLVAVTGGSRAASLAQEYGAEAEPDLDAFLARPDIDVVIISTPHAAHSKQAVAAAKAGKHILIDKPMATTRRGLRPDPRRREARPGETDDHVRPAISRSATSKLIGWSAKARSVR